jgi:hypothetical protein
MDIDFQTIIAIAGGAVGGLVLVYFAVRSGLVNIGAAIDGDDFADRAVAKMDAKVTPILNQIADLVNADTHGGTGHGPDNPA